MVRNSRRMDDGAEAVFNIEIWAFEYRWIAAHSFPTARYNITIRFR